MVRIRFAFLGLSLAITFSAGTHAEAKSLEFRPEAEDSGPFRNHTSIHWSAGLRAQAWYTTQAWTLLGADAMVFPWRHLGFGVTGLQGAGTNVPGCEPTASRPCGPYYRALSPFTELRLLPSLWASPYARESLGVAWGDFSPDATHPNSMAFVSRTELGVDLHYRASLRIFAIAEYLTTQERTLSGFGWGLQVGLSL
jgi:hypothetical protein